MELSPGKIKTHKRRAELLLELADITQRYPVGMDPDVAQERHDKIQSHTRKLKKFMTKCTAVLADDRAAVRHLQELRVLERELQNFEREYTLWWEKAKLWVREKCNDIMNKFSWFFRGIKNFVKKLGNFCTSLAGLGEYFIIVEHQDQEDPYLLSKREELDRKEALKKTLRGNFAEKKELVDLINSNQAMKQALIEDIREFIQEQLPVINQELMAMAIDNQAN